MSSKRQATAVKAKTNMYPKTKTWNPFKGCKFDCTYCGPSFKRQARRQLHICQQCADYVPHCHEKRLANIPSSPIVFVAGNADISFCPPRFTRKIIAAIKARIQRGRGNQTFYFQSKRPACFEQFLDEFPPEVILVTTLETNRDEGYREVSKAPVPSKRYEQFKSLDYPRKVVTVEPVMDFDLKIFSRWIISLKPEYVWLGLNSKKKPKLPEPSEEKLRGLVRAIKQAGIEVRGKELRGLDLGI